MSEENSIAREIRKRASVFGFFYGAIGAIAVLFIAGIATYILVDFTFLSQADCASTNGLTYCFFDKDAWNSETYLSAISGIYSNIIVLLVTIIAVISTLAYITIRTSARQHIEEAAEKEIAQYFDKKSTSELIFGHVKGAAENELGKINDRIDRIVELLETEGILLDSGFLEVGENDEEKTK